MDTISSRSRLVSARIGDRRSGASACPTCGNGAAASGSVLVTASRRRGERGPLAGPAGDQRWWDLRPMLCHAQPGQRTQQGQRDEPGPMGRLSRDARPARPRPSDRARLRSGRLVIVSDRDRRREANETGPFGGEQREGVFTTRGRASVGTRFRSCRGPVSVGRHGGRFEDANAGRFGRKREEVRIVEHSGPVVRRRGSLDQRSRVHRWSSDLAAISGVALAHGAPHDHGFRLWLFRIAKESPRRSRGAEAASALTFVGVAGEASGEW